MPVSVMVTVFIFHYTNDVGSIWLHNKIACGGFCGLLPLSVKIERVVSMARVRIICIMWTASHFLAKDNVPKMKVQQQC